VTPNDKLCEHLRHGVYYDGYEILHRKTTSIMTEGAARIEKQTKEIESLTAEHDRLRKALERVRDDIDENYDQFIGMPLLIRNSTIEEVRKTLKGA